MRFQDWLKPEQYTASPLRLAELANEFAASEVESQNIELIRIMAKTGYSFNHIDSGWLVSVDGTCVAEQLTGDELIAFLIDYDINES